MAKLIVKSPYLKCGGAEKVSGYLRYIGTREHVQKLTDDHPPNIKQEQLITKLSIDFPSVKKLAEYYGGDERKRQSLSKQKEFRAIKNAVIQEAEHIRLGEITFEDAVMEQRDEPEDNLQADRTLWQIVDDVYDDTLPPAERDKAVEDLRAWAEDGDATAQYFLGKLYRDGGLLIPNSELARDWFYKAARQDVVI